MGKLVLFRRKSSFQTDFYFPYEEDLMVHVLLAINSPYLSLKSSGKSSKKLSDVRTLIGFGEKSPIPGIETVTQP